MANFERRKKKYKNLANCDKKTGKSMKIWSILRGRFKKYENVANIDTEIEKVCKIWLIRF